MKAKIILLLAIFTSFAQLNAAPPVEEGKSIFSTRCAGCHNINKVITGPALAGVDQRRSMDWIINFVHSSQSLVKNGDKDAINLFEEFNRIPMPDHKDLSSDNIKSIVEYIKSEATVGGEEKVPFRRPGKLRPAYVPLSINNYGFFFAFLSAVVVLILGLVFAVHVKELEREMRKGI
jgi:mono/diheme cytochrome c family protein